MVAVHVGAIGLFFRLHTAALYMLVELLDCCGHGIADAGANSRKPAHFSHVCRHCHVTMLPLTLLLCLRHHVCWYLPTVSYIAHRQSVAGNALSFVVSWQLTPGASLRYVRTRMHLLMRMHCLYVCWPSIQLWRQKQKHKEHLTLVLSSHNATSCLPRAVVFCRRACSALTHDSVTRAGTVLWKARAGHAK